MKVWKIHFKHPLHGTYFGESDEPPREIFAQWSRWQETRVPSYVHVKVGKYPRDELVEYIDADRTFKEQLQNETANILPEMAVWPPDAA